MINLDPSEYVIANKPSNWNTMKYHEKVRHSCLYLTEKFSPFVDKIKAKDIVKSICGDKIEVCKIIRILDGPDDIKDEDLKPGVMIKASHGCKWNIHDLNKKTKEEISRQLHNWNKKYSPEREKQYAGIEPRFFIEECLEDRFCNKTNNAIPYKLFCIHGSPMYMGIYNPLRRPYHDYSTIVEGHEFKFYKINNESDPKILIDNGLSYINDDFWKRENMGIRIIELAKLLSAPFEQVRMDFYIGSNNKIYLSEYTFTPCAGNRIGTNEVEIEMGKAWL